MLIWVAQPTYSDAMLLVPRQQAHFTCEATGSCVKLGMIMHAAATVCVCVCKAAC